MLALTMGEPAGIGGEIALLAWLRRHAEEVPPYVLFDDPARLATLAERLGLRVAIEPVAAPDHAAEVFPTAIPVVPLSRPVLADLGRPHSCSAAAVVESIDRAVAAALAGTVQAVVTNPVHKSLLYSVGFPYPGHTEYLAAATNAAVKPVMLLVTGDLRAAPVTVHVSLKDAINSLTADRIVRCGQLVCRGLIQDFAIERPRLAVAALNPHAGEDGNLGTEDQEIIAPAIRALQREGITAIGPRPADTLFHEAARASYDAVLCMYHDQALIPIKTVDFWHGVNVTLGLPIIRTSPDHGTALDLAGTGRASPSSLIAALKLAEQLAANRARPGARASRGHGI